MSDYERIARVIQYLDRHHGTQPDLATLAEVAGLSRYHFHRLFARWAGVTPKDFLQCLTVQHAKRLLDRGASVLTTALESGLSGPGRLHDLTVRLEGASPGELKGGGAGWSIRAGFAATPFGWSLIGEGPRGLCELSFVDSSDRNEGERALRERWPKANLFWDDTRVTMLAEEIFRRATAASTAAGDRVPLRACVKATEFQLRVWRALLTVPAGALVSYGQIARALGRPGAARATGSAVASNPLAVLIPCHRVIRETGAVGEYRWGATRKRALLGWEATCSNEVGRATP